MSVSLREAIESAGFDLTTKEGCEWLLNTAGEYQSLLNDAENTIEAIDEDEKENCEHEDTWFDTTDNTDEYELNQAQGNTSFQLIETKIEICEFCDKQRTLPEGEWENV